MYASFNPATCFQNETDRLALISFKQAILQDTLQVLHSWNESFHFCNCFHGQIPQEMGRLRRLRYLILSNNSFQGLTLPNLRSLEISFNRFAGPVPISLSNASALIQIVIMSNRFSGIVPKEFGMLQHLLYLEFAQNQLQDDLSFINSITNCSSLLNINLSSNFLKGTLPNSIANLSKHLQAIFLSDNQLHDAIPLGIVNLPNLRMFECNHNYLTGPVVVDFEKLRHLEYLGLKNNKFTGIIPSSIRNLSFLSHVLMRFNNFNGSIPASLGTCHNLIELDLSHNSLSGSIPREVIGLASLSILLNLSSNELTGPILSEIGLLQNIAQLDLSDNRLSGMIPTTIGKCLSLEQLRLEGNSFDGEIPQVLSALQGLQGLDISRNNFAGGIPDSLTQLRGLKYLNLSFNQLHGMVPKRGIFLNASAISLMGNNDLCGGITEMKLPSCPITNSKKNNLSLALKVAIPVVVAAIFSVLLACSLIFWHRKRISRKKNISMPSFEHQFLRISYAELFKATDGFSMANIIGVGSYGSVYKGLLEQVGIQVAVKVLNLQRKGASNSFMSECQALRTIRHRNLLKQLRVCSSINFEGNDFKALIYEFMVNGSLEKWLHGRNVGEDGPEGESGNLKLMDRLNIAINIATAIEYLHNGSASSIIHGDLKPSNVLLDEEMTAHIRDFGLAKIVASVSGEIQQYQSSSTAIKGSIGYVAPEYGLGDPVSKKGDVYSYGILLLEMFTAKKPIDESFKDDLNLHTFVE
ncbi:hypothetical protein P3X46_021842 [Hevea brasiliensis]|uniref:Protein kinase domain-containing protein n=1 Tax=Hevea brasiliensis TaxID=3981 RepID=A0ABQ9LIT8_HEVBR|nr:hypothetical protein P3X46_021842 [Hevea brasiliensis]